MLKWPPKIEGEEVEDSVHRVFRWAYGIFDYSPDEAEWRMPEHWPLRSELEAHAAETHGRVRDDCDGFAALCRYALWDLGVPNRVLTCIDEVGGPHAVLTVEGTGLVLDNRYPYVVSRDELERVGYRWDALSGLEPNDPWTEVKR